MQDAEPDTRMSHRERAWAEQRLFDEVRAFLDELERKAPLLGEGELHTLTIRGGIEGLREDADTARYSIRVLRSQERVL